ncbi:TolB family protein [Chloroflexota bacterium]
MKIRQRVICTLILTIIISLVLLHGCSDASDKTISESTINPTVSSIDDSDYRIVFQSVRDAPFASSDYQANYQRYFDLYIMSENGSNVRRITDNLYWENQPDISPDGQKILFGFHEFEDSVGPVEGIHPGWEIAVMDIDGLSIQKLTNNDYMEFMPDWNHDGTKIVYMADANQRSAQDIADGLAPQYHIFTLDADGSNVVQLTFGDNPGYVNGDPSFSLGEPSKIVYIHTEDFADGGDLYTMDADGQNQQLILECDDELLKINDPTFSPDGNKIIFGAMVREDQYGNPIYNLFTMNTSSENLTSITEDDGEADILAQYSPDGSKICYMTWAWNGPGIGDFRIRLANANGSDEKVISSFQWEQAPAWVPIIEIE